jgi:hypothetical protein
MDEALVKKLAALRVAYARTLPGLAIEIEQAVTAWLADSDGARAAEVRRLTHRLTGTSGSYGLAEVSEAARALEALTAGPPRPDEIRAALERTVTACRAAGSAG